MFCSVFSSSLNLIENSKQTVPKFQYFVYKTPRTHTHSLNFCFGCFSCSFRSFIRNLRFAMLYDLFARVVKFITFANKFSCHLVINSMKYYRKKLTEQEREAGIQRKGTKLEKYRKMHEWMSTWNIGHVGFCNITCLWKFYKNWRKT